MESPTQHSRFPEEPFQSPPLSRALVLLHPKVARAQELIGGVCALLERHGVRVITGSVWDTQVLHEHLPEVDLCITLGGDGSLLRAARVTAGFGVPILGINLGRVGFLAELQPDEVVEHLPRIAGGNYWIEERMMLAAELHRNGGVSENHDSLNEVVVARSHLSRVIHIHTSIDGHPLITYTADGVLVATPTGSTAYSLAAGGPILHPEVSNLLLTPISPHLTMRSPLVLPNTTVVSLSVATDHEAAASFDGQSDIELLSGDMVVVRAGAHPARFLRCQERSYFYHTLIGKLRS